MKQYIIQISMSGTAMGKERCIYQRDEGHIENNLKAGTDSHRSTYDIRYIWIMLLCWGNFPLNFYNKANTPIHCFLGLLFFGVLFWCFCCCCFIVCLVCFVFLSAAVLNDVWRFSVFCLITAWDMTLFSTENKRLYSFPGHQCHSRYWRNTCRLNNF